MIALLLAAAAAAGPNDIRVTAKKEDEAVSLTPAQMFAMADTARQRNDVGTAEAIYRALAANPSVEIRNEARFRLARMLEDERRLSDSAELLRTILEEQPETQPVRLELAKVLTAMGDDTAARRELRKARSGELPPEVARQVDRFSEALRASKPVGATLDVAFTNDSNVNRATRSDTLGTVIGDFTLDEDARAQSGRGSVIQGEGYGRIALGPGANLLGTVSTFANLYSKSRFNDISVGGSVGPELTFGDYQLHASVGAAHRWYGHSPFTDAASLQLEVVHPLARATQLRGALAASRIWNHMNSLESGHSYSANAVLETRFSETTGGGLTLTGIRQALRDPGYSTKSAEAMVFGWHEAGRITFSGALTYGHLVADERLLLFLSRRDDNLYRASVGATVRQLEFSGFAPAVTFTWERNRSPIEIYDYGRTVVNLGVTRAF